MGFEKNAAALFLKMRADGVQLGRLLTLGHQNTHLDLDDYQCVLERLGQPSVKVVPEFADALLLKLGARAVEAMDFSAYEGAAVVHDLNQPIPAAWHQQYDTVFDGGTLEHVFNFPTAIQNCMQMLKPGGSFVSVTIPNNWCGHGFYQFSPELFFRVLGPDNGFSMREMYVAEIGGRCYAVKDPETVKSRVELCNHLPVFLLVHARREAVCDLFARTPQQSDYVSAWGGPPARNSASGQGWKNLPGIKQLRKLRKSYYARLRLQRCSLNNRQFYTPVDFSI